VEALLLATGAIQRRGSVDDATATTDFEPEEKERKISISPALANCRWGSVKLNLIDTPGYAEFIGQVVPCLGVTETALLVVDGVGGVEVQTRRMWSMAQEQGQAVVAMVSRIDKERADFGAVVSGMRESLSGPEIVPVQIPMGQEASLKGVIDLINMEAYLGDSSNGEAIPDEFSEQAVEARNALVDAVAATDDDLTMLYLENDELTEEELTEGLQQAVAKRQIIPVLASAAVPEIGVRAGLKVLSELSPTPLARKWKGTDTKTGETVELKPEDPFCAVVFKTLSDPYVGRISMLRMVSGTVQSDAQVVNANTGQRERLSGLSTMQGQEMSNAGTLAAGDLGCVTKLEHTITGHTLCEAKRMVVLELPRGPEGMHSMALEAASRADQDKLSQALARLAEEDVSFIHERSGDTGELVVRGLGPLHVDLAIERLKRKFGVQVEQKPLRVPYRETIRKQVEVQGRHKKQTGGRGQFADVFLRVEPLERGEGFEFVDKIVGGAIPKNFISAVEKGVLDAMLRGTLTDYPVVDIRVTLYDGATHPVDSSEQAFRMAGQIGMRKAVEQASGVLLEPVALVEVTTPESLTGDIMSDLNAKRGQIQGMDSLGGGLQVVRARVPLAELSTYASDLRSISQGRASYTMEFAHYQEVPFELAERIIAEAKAEEE